MALCKKLQLDRKKMIHFILQQPSIKFEKQLSIFICWIIQWGKTLLIPIVASFSGPQIIVYLNFSIFQMSIINSSLLKSLEVIIYMFGKTSYSLFFLLIPLVT
jgi:hypothetical protein